MLFISNKLFRSKNVKISNICDLFNIQNISSKFTNVANFFEVFYFLIGIDKFFNPYFEITWILPPNKIIMLLRK